MGVIPLRLPIIQLFIWHTHYQWPIPLAFDLSQAFSLAIIPTSNLKGWPWRLQISYTKPPDRLHLCRINKGKKNVFYFFFPPLHVAQKAKGTLSVAAAFTCLMALMACQAPPGEENNPVATALYCLQRASLISRSLTANFTRHVTAIAHCHCTQGSVLHQSKRVIDR